MLFGTIFSLAVAGLATSTQLNFEAKSDAIAAAKFLAEFNTELAVFDKIVADINKGNVNNQMNKWVTQGKVLADLADKAAPTIKASGPIDPKASNKLLDPALKFYSTVNSTFHHLVERRQIIIDAKLQGKVRESLVNGKHAIISMLVALPSQISPASQAQIESIAGMKLFPVPNAETLGPLIDRSIDYLFKVSREQNMTDSLLTILGFHWRGQAARI
jgi:hypothetical protein